MGVDISIGSHSRHYRSSLTDGPKTGLIFGAFFILFGAIFAGTGVKEMSRAAEFRTKGIAAQGVVTEVRVSHSTDSKGHRRTRHHATVKYQAGDGLTHTFEAAAKLSEGEPVPLLYLPERPEAAILKSLAENRSSGLFPLVFGLACAGAGIAVVVFFYKRSKQIAWLKEHGRKIKAKVIGITTTHNRHAHGRRRTYRVIAHGVHPIGAAQQFKSEALARDPGDSLIGQEVEVLVDPRNPRSYYLEVT